MNLETAPPGFRFERGLLWPNYDSKCAKVVFKMADDLDAAMKYVAERNVVIQAGGNCGVWPRTLAPLFGSVYTFEPDPMNYFALRHNTAHLSNVHAFNFALGAEHGVVSMFTPDHEKDNCGALQVTPGEGDIRMTTIDDFKPPGCDLLYLDIEGFELNALKGAVETLDAFGPVIVIEDKGLSSRYGSAQGDAAKWLAGQGYRERRRIHKDSIFTKGR